MTQNSLFGKTEGINRRRLLGGGAALVGGALVATALQSQQVHAEDKPAQEKPAKNAATPPNLDPPIVQVQGGKLRGFRDGNSTIFLGIPYAEAERFEQPKPVKPWDGVRSAQSYGHVCAVGNATEPGVDEFVFPHRYWLENEHCQFLNVWTPNPSKTARKPVMVWMHGGQFTNGSSMEAYAYDGKNLSEFGDVVVVSMNHRLNIIGTLDLSAYGPEYENSRYTGTADLLASVQWVHDNIENFGGDPGNVTLFGQSGGGGKVARMLHIPAAKGLFHRAISQSGGGEVLTDSDPVKNVKITQSIAAETLKNLNLTGGQIDKLKVVPYEALLAAGNAALKTVAAQFGMRTLAYPVYPDDKYVMREFCDWTSDIPLIFGTVFSEFIGNLQKKVDLNAWTPAEVEQHLTAAFGDKKEQAVAAFKSVFPDKKIQDFLFFAMPNTRVLAAKREAGKAPVYNYIFTYEYPVNDGILSFHTSEIAFVFHNLSEPHVRTSTGDAPAGFALQDKVSRAWINFAHTGNPSQPGLEWKPFAKDDPQTMRFDIESKCSAMHIDRLSAFLGSQGLTGPDGPAVPSAR